MKKNRTELVFILDRSNTQPPAANRKRKIDEDFRERQAELYGKIVVDIGCLMC